MVRMLGLGVLKDTNEEEVVDIVIPTHVMSQVEDVSTSFHHTIVTTKKGKIFGWGKANLFSNKLSGYYDRPVDITDEYLGEAKKSIKSIKAGVNYTVVLR
jgi:alpha-tubulin suppressor-like RCC1 family protein